MERAALIFGWGCLLFCIGMILWAAALNARAAIQYWLAWDYDYPSAGISFEVWHSTNLPTRWIEGQEAPQGFSLWTNADRSPVPLAPLQEQEWFIVRAIDHGTGLASDWNR